MNYRHAFHAGNFADVIKHLALIGAMLRLGRKPKPFAVIDSHGGRGLYNLLEGDAQRTREAEAGVLRLLEKPRPKAAEALAAYLRLAGDPSCYPGSPLIAARLLRPQDRLVAVEKHPEDGQVLGETLAPFARTQVYCGDGYARLTSLLPPPERRALILIDPPFEAPDEFQTCARAFAAAYRRFATGVYMLWFPIKAAGEAERFLGEILAAGAGKILRIDVTRENTEAGKLAAAGLVIVNPPFGFEDDMRAGLDAVLPRLKAKARFMSRMTD